MGMLQSLWQILVSMVRVPLRGVDWVKIKLGYVSIPPLREFVYLDQTSVISLIASTTGGVTEQKSTVKRRRISGSITGGLKNGGASVNSKIGATQEESSQAVRRYVIQSNFKELYDTRAKDMAISEEYEPQRSILGRIWARIRGNGRKQSIHPEDDLDRGDIIEINVRLGSDKIYEYYTVIESFSDIIRNITQSIGSELSLDDEDFSAEELRQISNLFEKLLEGLVPIVGEVVNYGISIEDGEASLVLKEHAEEEEITYDNLKVVGFVDSNKFWQNETRFLFDDDEYTIYCRLDQGAVIDEWVPIKLFSLIDAIVPGFSNFLDEIPEDMETGNGSSSRVDDSEIPIQPILEYFINRVKQEEDIDIEDEDVNSVIDEVIREVGETLSRNEDIENALEIAIEVFEDRESGVNLKESEYLDLVDEVLRRNFENLAEKSEEKEWYLPVSFTAIYW